MATLSASSFISLDGVVEAPERWHMQYFSPELGELTFKQLAGAEAILLGRQTHDDWLGFWPNQDAATNPFAGLLNQLPKYVASTTLTSSPWAGTTVLNGEARRTVADLKGEIGGEISVLGSATLTRSLLNAGLIDELRLVVDPIIVASGSRLLVDLKETALSLTETVELPGGVLSLIYRTRA